MSKLDEIKKRAYGTSKEDESTEEEKEKSSQSVLERIKNRVKSNSKENDSTNEEDNNSSLSVLERIKAKANGTHVGGTYVGGYDGGISLPTVKSWFDGVADTSKGLSEYYKANEGKWVTDYGADFTNSITNLRSNADAVGHYLRSHKNEFNDYDSLYKSYSDSLSYLDEVEKQNASMRDYYSQFANEDEYSEHLKAEKECQDRLELNLDDEKATIDRLQGYADKWKEATAQIPALENSIARKEHDLKYGWNVNKDKLSKEIAEEKARLESYKSFANQFDGIIEDLEKRRANYALAEKDQKTYEYLLLANAGDFAEKSKYVSTYRGGEEYNAWSNMYTDTGYDDIMYDYINGDERARSIKGLNDTQSNASLVGVDKSERREMTPEEIAIFNYIYATEGSEAAYEYVEHMTADLNARQRAKRMEEWAKYAEESPFGASVFSVIEAPLKGVSYFGQAADYLDDGKIDQNAGYNKFSYINSAIRNQVTKTVEEKWGGVGSFAYQTGMSMADFLFTTAISGGNSALSLGIMGTGAAADTVISAKDRGLSDDQAFALGTIAGAAEIITEKISLDALLDATQLGKNALGYVIKNVFAEGGEEVGSSLINLVADVLISKDKSEWQMAINDYKANGLSDKEAFWRVVGDQALSLGLDFLGGAVSGGVMGGGGVAINSGLNAVARDQAIKEHGQTIIDNGGTDSLRELALEVAGVKQDSEGNELTREGKKLASLAGKVEKKATAKNVGKLSTRLEGAITKQNSTEIESALVEKGLTKSEAKVAVKDIVGGELTTAEKSMIESDHFQTAIDAVLVDSDLNVSNGMAKLYEARIGKNSQNSLNSDTNSDIITNNESEVISDESTDGVHLRNGSERLGGTNTEESVFDLESGTGTYQSRRKTEVVADSEAARLANEGREVSVASLGILRGSDKHTVRLVDEGNETPTMKQARARASERGLNVKFFVGDNLVIADENGELFAARGYILGNTMLVRADHPYYTSDQITRHEIGHDMIAKGEVNVKEVQDRLKKVVGEENVESIADRYATAYEGTNMSPDEIWEECICDSLGDMNIFASDEIVSKFMAPAMTEVKAATENTAKSPTQTRGSPSVDGEGKASRITKERGADHLIHHFSGKINFDYSEIYLSDEELAIIASSIKTGWGVLNKQKTFGRVYTSNSYYLFTYNVDDSITIHYDIDVKTNKELIDIFEGVLRSDNRRKGSIASIGEWIDAVRSRQGGHVADNANGLLYAERGEETNAVDGGPSESDTGRHLESGAKNDQHKGKASRELDSPEEAKESGEISDAKFSIEFADDIANKQRKYAEDGLSRISSEELEKAIADTAHMVNEMKPYANILPQDKVGKTLVKNGSYDVSVENTTVCIRTLAYNSFVDMVSEKVGRPLTQMESFLVSQKLYEIAKEPQCLYCYVSLDRKAFNEMVIRYTEQREAAIKAYEEAGKPKIPSEMDAEWSLFKEFLDGRKPTKNMWDRYVGWLKAYNKGETLVSLSDISTEAKRLELVESGGEVASQVKDILKYAQSASWAKKQTQYVAYYDEILKLKPSVIRNLNNHYGMRWYSFSDYSGAFIVENMQQITDAAIRGLKGLSYTKDTDFAEIFAPTGMNINISVYATKTANGYEIDAKQSANIDEAIKLREKYPNVGIVVVATDKGGVEWALAQEWSDVVIPFHTVRTGADVAEFYNWEIFNAEQSDTVTDQNLWDAYVNDVGKKKASKNVYPSEHQNNKETYLSVCEKRGLTPRFKSFLDNPNYMKLVNETRQSEGETSPLKAIFDVNAAERSFDKFVEKGGYYEGWYNDGIDVDGEADIVAEDVRAGRKANEVSYGRQDVNFEDVAKGRKTNREHGHASRELDFIDYIDEQAEREGRERVEAKPMSNREILADALESVAQNDVERNKLKEYKEKIALIESEQAKLSEIRSKIKELSFAKGPRDTEAIKKLQFEANQAANRINTYDRQLLNLEATTALKGVLQREKEMARRKEAQKGKEALAKYREKAANTQRELMTRYQESRKKGIEGRKKTEMRHKIKDIVSELNTLLLKPTAKKHIKEELRKEVAEALSAINMDTVGAEERLAEINRKLQATSDPFEIEHLLESYNRISLQGDKLKDKLDSLNSAYAKIKNSDDIELNLAYQEVIQNSIAAVSEKVGNTSIRNMTLEQLEMVYELFSMIRKTIRNANKAFKAQKGETIMQMAEAVNDQVRTVGGQPYKRNVISAELQRLGWTFLKPYVAFRTIGSVTLTNMYRELRKCEDTFYGDVKEAQTFIEEQYKKHGYKSWDMKKTTTFTAKSGKTFDLTLEQMMTLYAYSRRDQAHKHIIEGGIVLEDALIVEKNKLGIPMKYEVTTKDAFNLSEETFAEIANSLSAEQKAFVDEMQAYLSITMGAKGNEVSMELLGVKLFKEEFYLPIKSSQYYMNFKAEEAGEVKLKSPAFSKETVQHANNPIVLHNFTDLWAEHINDMSMYHSFVLALEDFTRVYNYKTKTDEKVETMDTKATIETAYPGATKYINKFLKDMNGGVRAETVGWAEKLTSLAKKSSVLGSASVAIQQPSAVMRAMAYVNPIYFAATAPKSINLTKHGQDWAELKKYAPIAGIKEMGRFDVGMGQQTVDWIKSNKTVMNKVEDVLSVAPAFMDEVTWVSIWNAVKRETASKRKDLRPNSEEFLKVAGERFTEVISLSQVYDSVFSRSDLMRNKSWLAKALTAFMAEPSTTLNMLWDSWIQAKRSGGMKGVVKATATTGGAIVASIVLNSALKAIVIAMRDDDEDESYVEKYLEHFFGDLKDNLNPLTLIPFVKDIVSIYKGYDVERMDVALISDLKNAIDAFDSDNKTTYEKWAGLIGAISALFGVPVKNVERDIRAVINTIFGETEDTTTAGITNAIMEGWTGESKSNGQQLYEAMLNGDTEHIERVKGRFEDESSINSAVRSAIKEAYTNGDIDYETAMDHLIEYGGMKDEDEAYWAIDKWDYALENGATEDYSKYGDFYTAVETGKNLKAVIKEYTDHGVKTETLASQITSYYKPLYKNMTNSERASIKGYLLNAYEQLGYKRYEKSKDIDKWLED